MATNDSKEVLILQHVPSEGAGTVLDFLEKKKIPFQIIKLYENDPLPKDLSAIRAVLIMGGPMNVYEEDKYPFLKKEGIFIKQLISQNISCLGVCLGSQLIAKALGGKVYKAERPEIGWDRIELSREAKRDPLFSLVSSPSLRVLQWHEDTFDLPEKAEHLASSKGVPNQAYRYGDKVYGFQFHVEVNEAMLKDWFKASEKLDAILAEYADYAGELRSITHRMVEAFFSL